MWIMHTHLHTRSCLGAISSKPDRKASQIEKKKKDINLTSNYHNSMSNEYLSQSEMFLATGGNPQRDRKNIHTDRKSNSGSSTGFVTQQWYALCQPSKATSHIMYTFFNKDKYPFFFFFLLSFKKIPECALSMLILTPIEQIETLFVLFSDYVSSQTP